MDTGFIDPDLPDDASESAAVAQRALWIVLLGDEPTPWIEMAAVPVTVHESGEFENTMPDVSAESAIVTCALLNNCAPIVSEAVVENT